jgi:diaminopimelate decarboxylase
MSWWKVSSHLEIKNNKLFISGMNVESLAEKYGTPLFVINASRIKEKYELLHGGFQKQLGKIDIHYAMKANSTPAVLKLLEKLGSCIDAVSPFEVLLAEKVGFSKDRILFTGTSVSDGDMVLIAGKVRMNMDSKSQIKRYAKLVKEKGFSPEVSIRINPGKGAGHVPECMTAGEDAKFGIPEKEALEAYKLALELKLKPVGIHMHIGSQILEPDIYVFYDTSKRILDLAGEIKKKLRIDFEFIDLGGGIGIPYKAGDVAVDITEFSKEVSDIVKAKSKEHNIDFNLKIEPGRFLVGDSTILLVKAVDINDKYVPELGVNAGFNVFYRPAMYKTYHEIVNASNVDSESRKKYRVSGNLCESGDVFTESKHSLRELPATKEGDVLAILNAGAYGITMGSNYNLRPRAREIMILNGNIEIVKEKEIFEDLIRNFKL